MTNTNDRTYTAFADSRLIAHGSLPQVAAKAKKFLAQESKAPLFIFDDQVGAEVDIDFRGTEEAVLKRLAERFGAVDAPSGPGRPKLGVVSREIGLLPRHWEWLALQPGGASATLRKLVDEAKKKNSKRDEIRQSQDATYKVMLVLAGDLPQYEEALRALYAKNEVIFETLIAPWPKDVRHHLKRLSAAAFSA